MRKEMFNKIREIFKEKYSDLFDSVKLNQKWYELTVNNQLIIIGFDTLRYGSTTKDHFMLTYSISIENKEIFKIKKATNTTKIECNYVIHAKEEYFWPEATERGERCFVCGDLNKDVVINNVIEDLGKYVFPIAFGFTRDYESGIKLYEDLDFKLFRCMNAAFATGIIMAYLADKKEWIKEKLIPLMESYRDDEGREWFDYYKVEDPIRDILLPIEDYFSWHTVCITDEGTKVKATYPPKMQLLFDTLVDTERIKSFTEEEAFQLILDARKLAFGEQGTWTIDFFSHDEVFPGLIYLGNKYKDNEKLIIELIRTLGIQTQFLNYHKMVDENFKFLLKNRDHKSRKIQYEVSRFLFEYPKFDKEWKGKWEYILKIPELAPKKYSKDFFIWAVYNNKKRIPEEYKSEILKETEKIIEKDYAIGPIVQERINEIINILKS